jgi:hypothetical protein
MSTVEGHYESPEGTRCTICKRTLELCPHEDKRKEEAAAVQEAGKVRAQPKPVAVVAQPVTEPLEIDVNDYTCKVCGNVPDMRGTLNHGKGCYMISEEGGGTEFVDFVLDNPDNVAIYFTLEALQSLFVKGLWVLKHASLGRTLVIHAGSGIRDFKEFLAQLGHLAHMRNDLATADQLLQLTGVQRGSLPTAHEQADIDARKAAEAKLAQQPTPQPGEPTRDAQEPTVAPSGTAANWLAARLYDWDSERNRDVVTGWGVRWLTSDAGGDYLWVMRFMVDEGIAELECQQLAIQQAAKMNNLRRQPTEYAQWKVR